MNKKKLLVLGLFGMFAISLVAAVSYYALFSATITVVQPIIIGGNLNPSMDCEAGATCLSETPITIENIGDTEKIVSIVKISGNDSIEVSYVGKMQFATKNLETGDTTNVGEEVVYTITGETFEASNIPTTHKLIYYPDMEGGFTNNVANILVYGTGDVFPSLPLLTDIGDNYCDNPFNEGAKVCNGAKLWLVENDYVTELESGIWTPSRILFETDLITYTESTSGEITIPANSMITVYPAFTPGEYITGGAYGFEFEIQ